MESIEITNILDNLARNSSQEALQELYLKYYKKIYRYIGFYVRKNDVIAELVSDVFFALWEQRIELTQIKNFDGYIYRIAKYKALNYLRKRNLNTVDIDSIPFDLFDGTISSPEDNIISIESVQDINKAIEQLPPKCKLAFKLVREDGLSHKEAAEALGITVKTLSVHLTRAMHKIRECVKENEK